MMTPKSRAEMNKLRELVHFLLQGAGSTPREVGADGAMQCFFCKKRLDDYAADFTTHGNSTGPKLTEKLSIHHVNGDHDDNELSNKALSHTSCHKGYHRRIANEERELRKTIALQQPQE